MILLIIAFSEAIIFPLPVDPLLVAMAIANRKRALLLGVATTICSVLGGAVGYLIGLYFIDTIGIKIIEFYRLENSYLLISSKFETYSFITLLTAAISPLPYKLFTIAAGTFNINFITFLTASIIGRGGRFMLEAWLIYIFGDQIKEFIDKYINLLIFLFSLLLIGGFIILKFFF